MNLLALRARVRIDPSINSTTVISVADLDTLLNEGALDLNRQAGILRTSGTFPTVANQQTYVLSGVSPVLTNFLDINWEAGGVIYTQSVGVVKTSPNHFGVASESWLDLHFPGWQNAASNDTPSYVYLSYDSSQNLVLGQYPAPLTAVPSWKIYFVARGTDMVGTADFPWTGVGGANLVHLEPFHKGICYYALWQAHTLKTFRENEAKKYFDLYNAEVEKAKEAMDKLFEAEIVGTEREARLYTGQSFGGR